MKNVLQINLKLLTTANSVLLNIVKHEKFSANKYENANYCCIFIFISRENFKLSLVEHKKGFITTKPDFSRFISHTLKQGLFDTMMLKRHACIVSTSLTLVPLNPDMPCLCKQCRSKSISF